jgi:putative PIN family toxin of toxin-antitoxin system
MSQATALAAVYDCMVYLQAAMSVRGPAARCLEAAEGGQVQLFVSEAVLAEVEEVLTRPAVRRKRAHLTPAYVAAVTERIRRTATVVDPVPHQFSYLRDPKDEPYLNLALAAGVAYLVSRDSDLLDLQNPNSHPGQELRRFLPQLTILDPVAFIQLLPPVPDEAS